MATYFALGSSSAPAARAQELGSTLHFADGWPGVVAPLDTIVLASAVPGKVERLPFAVGETVPQGAAVVKLDQRLLRQNLEKAQAGLEAARAQQEGARLRFERFTSRLERFERVGDLISHDELAEAELEAAQAKADLGRAQAEKTQRERDVSQLSDSLADSTLRAPFTGTLEALWVDPGAIVAAGEPIARVVSATRFRLRFAIPAAEMKDFDATRKLTVRTGRGSQQGNDRSYSARALQVASSIDLATQMIFIEAEFQDPDSDLRIGQSVWVQHDD